MESLKIIHLESLSGSIFNSTKNPVIPKAIAGITWCLFIPAIKNKIIITKVMVMDVEKSGCNITGATTKNIKAKTGNVAFFNE